MSSLVAVDRAFRTSFLIPFYLFILYFSVIVKEKRKTERKPHQTSKSLMDFYVPFNTSSILSQ